MSDSSAPVGAYVKLDALSADPYPIYKRLRELEPVSWVAAANRYLVTRYEDIRRVDRQPDIFSNEEPDSLVLRAMGPVMMRKDGSAHTRQRRPCEPPLRPSAIRAFALPKFHEIADELIDGFIDRGHADLFTEFASPCAALGLRAVLGVPNVSADDLLRWCQAFIDGSGNYGNDSAIWARCNAASDEVNLALDEMIPFLRRHPDETVLSAMVNSPDPRPIEEIRADIKVFIGGGVNEPRDAITSAIWALLTHPDQYVQVMADPTLWRPVFEETIRWIAPIGMYPRFVTKRTELGDTILDAGTRIGVVIASANRDDAEFTDPDKFDIKRARATHAAFGAGPHYCLGAWAARMQVADVALPKLMRRLPNVRLTEEPVRFAGWVFRGALNLPVTWSS